ncbi:MAG TPA: S8 family serine peptidase [Archangium sp.]|jgi:subtilisin family serine protease|uniref:S8 family serine peptidase n=1 Tax=Archangium sp. TaxID=1872627 RepID=UPI002EDA757F
MNPTGGEQVRRDGREPVLVRFRPVAAVSALAATRAHEAEVERVGGHVRYTWPRLHALAAWLRPEERQALARSPDVLALEPDGRVRASGVTPLGEAVLAGSPGEYTEGLRMIQAPQVWDADEDGTLDSGAPTGEGLKVCVIDSGWDDRHPELQAAYAGGWDFLEDDSDARDYSTALHAWGGGHGTHVAAILAARLGSGGGVRSGYEPGGVVGVAPGASLLIARVLDIHGQGRMSDVIEALQWCRGQGARIASLSLASPTPGELVRKAFEDALSAGMLSVAASGNAGMAHPSSIAYPAAYPSVLAVGAVDLLGQHLMFSQSGPELGLVAPGMDVLSATLLGAASCSSVEAGERRFASQALESSGPGDSTGPLVDCGLGESATSCGQSAPTGGFIALVARDGNSLALSRKVSHVVAQGARAVIIRNDVPEDGEGTFSLTEPGPWPPVVSVSYDSGMELGVLAGTSVRVSATRVDYARMTGTSMATAYVSGVAALVWSARPSLTPMQVHELLRRSASELGAQGHDDTFGWGLVQARAALELLP